MLIYQVSIVLCSIALIFTMCGKSLRYIGIPWLICVFFVSRNALPSIVVANEINDVYSCQVMAAVIITALFMMLGYQTVAAAKRDMENSKFKKYYCDSGIMKADHISERYVDLLAVISLLVVIYYFVIVPSLPLIAMLKGNLLSVELAFMREESLKLLNVGIMIYPISWVSTIIFPIITVFYLLNGNKYKYLAALIIAFVYCAATGAKAPVASLLLTNIIALLFKKQKSIFNLKMIVIGIIIIMAFPIIMFSALATMEGGMSAGEGWSFDIVGKSVETAFLRLVRITGVQPYYWMAYFPDLSGGYLYGASIGMLSKLLNIPFFNAPNEVARVFSSGAAVDTGSQNAVFFADAYANFGWIGVVVFAYLAGIMIAAIHYYFMGRQKNSFYVAIYISLIYPVSSLCESALTTVILTGGIAVAFAIVIGQKMFRHFVRRISWRSSASVARIA